MRESKSKRTGSTAISEERISSSKKTKKAYSAPVLEHYGNLDALTMSVGAGSGDGMGGTSSRNPCWIAEVLYGADDHRTRLLRTWLTHVYSHTAVGAPLVALYRACGTRVAGWARRSPLLRRVLTPLFDAGIAAALRHYTLAVR